MIVFMCALITPVTGAPASKRRNIIILDDYGDYVYDVPHGDNYRYEYEEYYICEYDISLPRTTLLQRFANTDDSFAIKIQKTVFQG